ncbi:hypothetical protein [Dyella koreensis]|uniref:Uncharacterized protein n=1 Tax=Dyella koreensis TaxID=311235 RepID=A0ABW8K936_9GAMM
MSAIHMMSLVGWNAICGGLVMATTLNHMLWDGKRFCVIGLVLFFVAMPLLLISECARKESVCRKPIAVMLSTIFGVWFASLYLFNMTPMMIATSSMTLHVVGGCWALASLWYAMLVMQSTARCCPRLRAWSLFALAFGCLLALVISDFLVPPGECSSSCAMG